MAHILEGYILKLLDNFEFLHVIYVKSTVSGND